MMMNIFKTFLIPDYIRCRITSIHYSEKDHTATIAFEKRDATQTALMVSAISLISCGID
jgi:hypothetical protein